VLEATFELEDVADENTFPYDWDGVPGLTRVEDKVRLVPYFAWGNRRPGETMRVWIPGAVTASES
jgi:DUF1680 family protein